MNLNYKKIGSPVGPIYIVEGNDKLRALIFGKNWSAYERSQRLLVKKSSPLLMKTEKQLKEYFKGIRTSFSIPYELEGTRFQKRVWKALGKIPFGKTKSYKEQAGIVKSPRAVRAVGRTNGLNPIAIILPCHRVIGANGALTGFAGGLGIKRYLLALEGIQLSS